MLNRFISWAKDIESKQANVDAVIHITFAEPSDNRSVRMDIDTKKAVARITCWESGDFDAEIIDIESERQLYEQHGALLMDENIFERFKPFFDMLEFDIAK